MGVFIVCLGIAVLLLVVGIVLYEQSKWNDYEGFVDFGVVFMISALVMGCFILHEYAFKDLTVQRYLMRYETLKAQYEEGYYDRITYDGREGLMDKILDYNDTVLKGRTKHHSAWIGAFYPEDWDSLPLIELGGQHVTTE